MLLLVVPPFGLLGASVATAQDSAAAHKIAAIRARMERGQALFVAGDFEGAAQIFDEGYQAYPYSAFLFNAGVCYKKLGRLDLALARFRDYVRADPTAPDVQEVRERIARLEEEQAAAASPANGDVDAGSPDAGVDGAPEPSAPPSEPTAPDTMKSLVVIETEPPGAPLSLYLQTQPNGSAFRLGMPNPGWTQVATLTAPANLTLAVGHYHVVVEKFRDFNESHADIYVTPGRVLHFQANLSQGVFMAYLRVSSNVAGARIFVDDAHKRHAPWGTTPHGELVAAGRHTVLVEAPGHDPAYAQLEVASGETRDLELPLQRVGWGTLRIDANAPEVTVSVEGRLVGTWRSGEPPLEVSLPASRVRVTLQSAGRKTYHGEFEVPRGQALPVHGKLMPTYPRGAAWTQAVIGGVFLGAAVYFGVESDRLHSELSDDRNAGVLEQEDSRLLRGQIYSIGADVGFVVGGVLGLLATYNFVRDPLPDSAATKDAPVEFDAPRSGPKAAAQQQLRRQAFMRQNRRPRAQARIGVSPLVGEAGGGVALGGRFW